MIKFFRKIRQKLLSQNQVTRYLVYAIGEILLVTVGILIALQINTWNDERKASSQEVSNMKEIFENLDYDINRYQNNRSRNLERSLGLDSLRIAVSNAIGGADETVNIYYYALLYGQEYAIATLNRSGYDQLINSKTIQLIDNRQLAQNLTDYYERNSMAAMKFEPVTSLNSIKTIHRKFLQLRGLDDYIRSFDTISDSSYLPDYDYAKILMMKDLQLLNPVGLTLDDYLNEIAQFQIDLKKYNFYLSWGEEAAQKLIVDLEKEYRFGQE